MTKNAYDVKIEIAQLASQLLDIERKAHDLIGEAERIDDGEFGHDAIFKARWETHQLQDIRQALLGLVM